MTDVPPLSDDDTEATKTIVQYLKSQGVFDEFRKECLSDVDTKPSFLNLRQRTEGYVQKFLSNQPWHSGLNKNQLRESLRRQINESGMVKFGVEHLVEQVIHPKAKTSFYPKIESIVKQFLGIKDDIVWPEEEASEPKPETSDFKEESSQDASESQDSHFTDWPTVAPKPDWPTYAPKRDWPTVVPKAEDDKSKSDETSQSSMQGSESGQSEAPDFSKDDSNSVSRLGSESSAHFQPSSVESEQKKEDTQDSVVNKEEPKDNKDPSSCSNSSDYSGTNASKDSSSKSSRKRPLGSEAEAEASTKRQKSPESEDKKDYLSDVSSVHTSDLSEFDDNISLSSEDEENKVKISLKDVKQMGDVTKLLTKSLKDD